ncbi:antitermination protein Q [Edwardsiella tarda]
MNLENAVKFFAPKTPSLSDAPRATATDGLTGTDVMAAMGMCQSSAEFGFSAFMGKVGVSVADRDRAVQLLTQFGLKQCDKVAAIRKLSPAVKAKVVTTLASFAYRDYCRSAAGQELCDCCNGLGMVYRQEDVVKHPGCGATPAKVVTERVGHLCRKCGGKGVVSAVCNDCRGRRVAIDRKETERQGIPVQCSCKRCGGRGYRRLPAAKAYQAISHYIKGLPEKSWRYSYKPLYELMVVECERQETIADQQLKKITR